MGRIMNTLIVYEMVPEDTYLYIVPSDVVEPYLAFFQKAQGSMVNTYGLEPETKEAADVISALLADPQYEAEDWLTLLEKVDLPASAYGALFPYRITASAGDIAKRLPTADANIDRVFFTGFLL